MTTFKKKYDPTKKAYDDSFYRKLAFMSKLGFKNY